MSNVLVNVDKNSQAAPSEPARILRSDELTSPVESPMRASELWIPALIALVVGLRWLLGERHSLYGDEHFHLTALVNGIAGASQGTLVDRFVNLYLFHFAYPPVFHLLAAPFVLPAADPVLGGRVYAQALTLLVALTLYAVTRRVGGKVAGTIAVLTLLGTPSFVDPSRHYLLETLITLEVLLLLYFIGRYAEERRLRYLLPMGVLIVVGLLTKFNFFFYAAWLFVVPGTIECYRIWRGQQPLSTVFPFAAIIVALPLAVAGPWYVVRFVSPNNALELLGKQLAAGQSVANLTPDVLLFPVNWNYSPLLVFLAVLASVIYVCYWLKVPGFRTALRPMAPTQAALVTNALVAAYCALPVLALSGMGGNIRWHIEAAFFFTATFGILGRLRWRPLRFLGLGAAAVGAVFQLTMLYVRPLDVPNWLKVPDLGSNPIPSAIPIGSELLAQDIARHERRVGGTKPGEFAYFLYHEHGGPHFGTVEYYLREEGAPLGGHIAAFWNRPIDINNLFGAKYLVESVARYTPPWIDPETERYERLVERMPPSFRSILVEVSDVEGRLGHFKAYYVPRQLVTREMVMETIDTGRKLETVPAFTIFWEAQHVIWRAEFETVEGNLSLQREIDAVVAHAPAFEPALTPMNRDALRAHLAKIAVIRSRVGNVAAANDRTSPPGNLHPLLRHVVASERRQQ